MKEHRFQGESSLVRIREKRDSDHALLITLRTNLEIQSSLASRAFNSSDIEAQDWIERADSDTSRLFGIIERADNGTAIGFIQIFDWNHPTSPPQLGIAISPQFQGKKFGSSAITLAMQILSSIGVKELELEVRDDNKKAWDLYARLGFVHVNSYSLQVFDGRSILHRLRIDLDEYLG
jgi:RimJ/RimL family protein N-acetyltransferase